MRAWRRRGRKLDAGLALVAGAAAKVKRHCAACSAGQGAGTNHYVLTHASGAASRSHSAGPTCGGQASTAQGHHERLAAHLTFPQRRSGSTLGRTSLRRATARRPWTGRRRGAAGAGALRVATAAQGSFRLNVSGPTLIRVPPPPAQRRPSRHIKQPGTDALAYLALGVGAVGGVAATACGRAGKAGEGTEAAVEAAKQTCPRGRATWAARHSSTRPGRGRQS